MIQDIALKDFMEQHFDFDGLKAAGFWPKGTKRKDYAAQAARVCQFFGLKTVYEYAEIGKDVGCHIDENPAAFNCPICTCPQYVKDSQQMRFKMKCVGCKRTLKVVDTYLHGFIVTAADDEKDKTETRYRL